MSQPSHAPHLNRPQVGPIFGGEMQAQEKLKGRNSSQEIDPDQRIMAICIVLTLQSVYTCTHKISMVSGSPPR
jgi:hypothetical protein